MLATAAFAAPFVAPLAPPAGGAEATVTYAAVLPARATDWTDVVTLPRFDPALGELRVVELTVEARLTGTIALENLGEAPVSAASRLAAAVRVQRPGAPPTALVSAEPAVVRTQPLAPYDGVLDHAGSSGQTTAVSATATAVGAHTDPADLTLFTGTSPIGLPSAGTDTSVPPVEAGVVAELSSTVGATVTVSYTYLTDTRPPDPPTILSSPPALTADPLPVVTFTAEPGAAVECQLEGPAGAGGWAGCTSPWSTDLTTAADGPYTVRVRATDAAGNVGDPAARSFTLDRQAPGAPTLTFTPPALGRNPLPTWAFTLDVGSTARCSLDGAPPAACGSPYVGDLSASPDGPHLFSVVAVDGAGNVSPPATHLYTLDRVAPAPPQITSGPPSPGNDSTPSWALTLATDATAASCSLDGAPFVACGPTFTADLSGVTDGPHSLQVRNTDAAGNQSSTATATYVLDRAAPGAPIVTGPPSPSNDPSPVWTIAAEPGSTTECRLDAGPWAPCDGGFTTSFGPGSDGVHALSVRATDAAGNQGPEVTTTYTLDTTPPPAPTLATAPAATSNSAMPTWTFTVEPGATASCSLDSGPWGPCASPLTVDLTAAPDGYHELAIRATDAQGNVGPITLSGFTLDRLAPAAPEILTAPASPGSAATVTWTFTTPEGAETRCRIDDGPMLPCADSRTVTFSDDGPHRFAVASFDTAGNRSASAVAMYTLDRLAPAPPTITGGPPSPSQLSTPQWTFTVEHQSAGECSIDGGAWIPCTTTFSADLSGALDGAHTFRVRSADLAGNVGATATATYVLDRTPPGAPVISGGPPADSRDDTPTWTIVVDGDARAECRIDDGPWLPCADSITADLVAEPDGLHALEVRAIDPVGNVSPTSLATYDLDRLAPEVPAFTSVPVSPGNAFAPEWAFTYEPGTTAWCALDGADPVACEGTYAAGVLPDGTHTLVVTVTDAAGNTSPAATNVYELDTSPPAAPVLSAPRTPDREVRPTWGIALEPGAVAECSLDTGEPVACGDVFTVDLLGQDGPHRLVVVARDAAGNESAPASSTYVLDTVPPAAPNLLHTPDRSSWTWRFAFEPGATAECSLDGVPWSACTSPLPAGAPDRAVRFEVRAVDRAGNRSPVTATTVTPTLAVAPIGPPPATPAPAPGGFSAPPGPTAGALPRAAAIVDPPAPSTQRPPLDALAPREARERESIRATLARGLRSDGFFARPVRELLQAAAETTTIPVLVVLIVLAFVAVQNRIDRRDPKLAAAPLRHEPEYMEFE